jgi:hypothetical protein
MPTDVRLVASTELCFPRNEGEERRLMEKSGAKEVGSYRSWKRSEAWRLDKIGGQCWRLRRAEADNRGTRAVILILHK